MQSESTRHPGVVERRDARAEATDVADDDRGVRRADSNDVTTDTVRLRPPRVFERRFSRAGLVLGGLFFA
ncbi:MAG: hypothetical protein WCG47_05370, partial [Dermatophilaceae bacterium]